MKLFPCFVIIFLTSKGIAQVGLLSSNNKQASTISMDTSALPMLSVAAFKTDTRLTPLGDTLPITIRAATPVEIAGTTNALRQAKNELSTITADLAMASRSLKKAQKAKQTVEILKYRKVISDLKSSEVKQAALIKNQQKALDDLKAKNEGAADLNTLLIGKVINARKKLLNDSLTNVTDVNKNILKDIYKNQYAINSYWFLVDSTKETFNKNKFLDSLSTVYSDFRQQIDDDISNKQLSNEYVKAFNTLAKDSAPAINTKKDFESYIKTWDDLSANINKLNQNVTTLKDAYTASVKKYNDIIKNNIKDKIAKKDDKTSDFGAFPQLTSILGKRETIPTLQVYGSYNYKSQSSAVEGNIGLSFSPKGSPSEVNLYSIFLQNASAFLINSNFAYSFLTAERATATKDSFVQKLAINLGVSYAGKSILFDTTKSKVPLNSSIFYTKVGLELAILPKRLSVYGNINTATLFDKVAEFKDATGIDSKFFGFIDCGSKFFLDPTPRAQADGLFIFLNTNFLINGGDVKRVTKSEDLVIPSIQVGIVKQLGKF